LLAAITGQSARYIRIAFLRCVKKVDALLIKTTLSVRPLKLGRMSSSRMRQFSVASTITSWIIAAALPLCGCDIAHAEIASIYGGSDGLCGHRTASGERLNCAAMTAAHRTLPFGTLVTVCHSGCVTVRVTDRGPRVRGRQIDLSPAAARAIGLYKTGHVTISAGR
jgi:rare lipoprotein A (peptidoglycan hydrolase)